MRLVQVAKALHMTGQQLRHELTEVDFGVKASDREIPDVLAQGILRVLSRKHGIAVDMEALGFTESGTDGRDAPSAHGPVLRDSQVEEPVAAAVPERPAEESVSSEGLKVLRKLTLDGVSQEAVAKERKKLEATQQPTKAGREALRQEKQEQSRKRHATAMQQQIKRKEGTVALPAQLTVKEFAEKTGVQIPAVVQVLMKNGVMATINQPIDYDTAAIVAAELRIDVRKEEGIANVEHLLARNLQELLKDEPETLLPRPPIVAVMGHVDHGKTSILDAIRQTDVVAGESGGITQHIGAYQIVHRSAGSDEEHPITFLDTPGHEAFTAMRARGAQVTDIVIIVVAADEGVMPTTVEAINHAKEAGVSIIVALNKMDKENADPDKVKGELAAQGLQPEDWGGNIPVLPCSAANKQGIPELLDHIVFLSQLQDFRANPNRSAVATVIESHLDPSHGPLATLIVNAGTLRTGDAFLCGAATGKVRVMMDARGERREVVPPSGTVRVSGFSDVPSVGDILQVVPSEHVARSMASELQKRHDASRKRSFADLVSRLSEGQLRHLKIVLKADTHGSLEAIQDSLNKKATDAVNVKVIHSAVGGVSENDVMMASASDGIVVAFHVPVPVGAKRLAEREGVKVRSYDIIYALLDDIDALLLGLVEPEEQERVLGHLAIRGVFLTKRSEQIVGGKVTDGIIKRVPFRIQRDGQDVGTGRITSLKKVDKDIKEAKEGTECGMKVETSIPLQEGDVLEAYIQEFKRKES
ncbi:MAG: translation initiation factor IF-2 [Candidatus Peribacteraceae bacterium]